MTSPLAVSFRSSNALRNIVIPGDRVTVEFSAPPQTASNVLIKVSEKVVFLDGKTQDRPLGGFRGRIVGGRFEHEASLGAPFPALPDPETIDIALGGTQAPHRVLTPLQQPHLVESHALRLAVTGDVQGRAERFEGDHLLQVEYPMAMVIPQTGAALDGSLDVVRRWAAQWSAHKPQFRKAFPVPIGTPGAAITPADYDPLISALSSAATFAKAGVVALAVGHGDPGDPDGTTVAWCNLVPENQRVPVDGVPFRYRLDIDESVLGDGLGAFPGGATQVKLDAIDRIGDALVAGNTRRLLLHTCKAGASALFMQRLADRLRVAVFAHTAEIEYTIATPVLAAYAKETPVRPAAEVQWPVSKLGPLARPGNAPKRHGQPQP